MELSKRVRARRTELGLTQAQLAQAAGLQLQTIWRYEHGTQKPQADSIQAVAVALNVSVDWLLGSDGADLPTNGEAA